MIYEVQEFFADVFAVNDQLFSLNMLSTIGLTSDHSTWSAYEEALFARMVEGVLGSVLSLRLVPTIRYAKNSALCRKLAFELQKRMEQERSLFDHLPDGGDVLLLMDRRNDPVTPLLNQWTYQAMLHELLGMENNRIDMSKVPGIRPEHKEIVMSATQDQFFEDNIIANFGDLGISIKKYVEDYQKQTKNTA